MKRIRAVAILIKGDEILLMHRIKNGKEYYCFSGGGVKEGESMEQATLRELKEETTIDVKINKLLYHHIYDNDTEQYFYLCDYISGEPKLGEGSEEKTKMLGGNNIYDPLWIKIEKLKDMLVYPLEIRNLFIKDFKNNFINPINTSVIKISDLRQTI